MAKKNIHFTIQATSSPGFNSPTNQPRELSNTERLLGFNTCEVRSNYARHRDDGRRRSDGRCRSDGPAGQRFVLNTIVIA